MADNVAITAGSGTTIATDDDGTAHHQYVKVEFGADNTQTKVSSSNPLPVVHNTTDTVTVKLDPVAGLIGIKESIAVHILSTGGTIQVGLDRDKSTLTGILSSIGVNLGKVDGTIQVNVGKVDDYVAIKAGSLSGSLAVHLLSTGGTVAVKIDPGYNVVNAAHTLVLARTVSGSTSGVSASGVQLVAPDSGNAIKVCAYSIQTTGAVSMAIKFTNGAGTSPTEYWRPLVTASGVTGVQGANLAVTPPGYLFATAANTTLAIVNDSASLIHYSVSYFKESV